jgi:hypothetical protein
LGNLILPKIIKLYFEKNCPRSSTYWVKISSKCDLDPPGYSANYFINGPLQQTSYFEHCLGEGAFRFESGFDHFKLDQRPPAATDQPACMDPPADVTAVGAISDHGYPGFYN